ncbi:MAG TPA: hypothetical protein VF313_08890, partial [Anaerolineaceae bacterium]
VILGCWGRTAGRSGGSGYGISKIKRYIGWLVSRKTRKQPIRTTSFLIFAGRLENLRLFCQFYIY